MSDHIWTPTSTLGDIADALRPMKDGGMTRDSMLFVIDKVWFEATQEEADGTAHDAAVAARALREFVAIFDGDCIDLWEEFRWTSDAPLGWSENSVAFAIDALSLIGPWIASRADRIEREGETDADA